MAQEKDEICGNNNFQRPPTCYWKNVSLPDAIGDPIKYSKYKTEND